MQLRQAALGGFLAAALIVGGYTSPAAQTGGQAPAVGAMAQLGRPASVVFDGLHTLRNAALDVVCDAFGALIAAAKQF
jgi:hypothetical protein